MSARVLPDLRVVTPEPLDRPRGAVRRYDHEQICKDFAEHHSIRKIVEKYGCCDLTARNIVKGPVGVRSTKSRFVSRPLDGQRADMPPYDHPALMAGHTIYPATVRDTRDRWALKSGHNTAKIGAEILKGKWKGFPVYTLTLEERATCPKTCAHWRSCYGNKMHLADRVQAGPNLEWRLEREVAALELDHQSGFVIRLHNLGDFYSVAYVELWAKLLDRHSALHCFGYSARWRAKGDPIALALLTLVENNWNRFAIRMSDAPVDACSTISIEHPYQAPDDAIICPEQIGKTESCSTCGLCWQSKRRIAFLQH